ncbi:MAG: putrescine aminotransferase, partial [Acidobacteria bacterium]
MNSPFETLAQESQWWLDIISSRRLGVRRRQRIAQKTLENFRSYYNRGVLHYSKAVAEANGMTAIEWSGHGSAFSDLEGREYIDCLGGYGIYSAGIRHPKIVKAVGDQLQRMPLSSQELLDPLRGALSHLLGEL